MTFVLDDSRDRLASQIAARENAASEEARGRVAECARARRRGGQRFEALRGALASAPRSHRFAAELRGTFPTSGIKRAGFYVLAGARHAGGCFRDVVHFRARSAETRFNTGDFRQKNRRRPS